MKWYYALGSNQMGPVSDAELGDLARAGKIQAGTLVWHAGQDGWLPYGQIAMGAGLPQPTTPPPPPTAPAAAAFAAPAVSAAAPAAMPSAPGATTAFCAACGQQFEQENMIHYMGSWICMTCKPAYFQRMREGAAAPGGVSSGFMDYAGFWTRFGAWFIDYIIVNIVGFVLGMIIGAMGALGASSGRVPGAAMSGLQLMAGLISLTFTILYKTFFIGQFAATPGKMALGLKVVTAEGEKVSFLRALGRAFAEILSSCVCLIGYIIAAFDEEKRALHDHICGTRVVKK